MRNEKRVVPLFCLKQFPCIHSIQLSFMWGKSFYHEMIFNFTPPSSPVYVIVCVHPWSWEQQSSYTWEKKNTEIVEKKFHWLEISFFYHKHKFTETKMTGLSYHSVVGLFAIFQNFFAALFTCCIEATQTKKMEAFQHFPQFIVCIKESLLFIIHQHLMKLELNARQKKEG